ncbi:MAG: hypothetical protein F6K18_21280 [Okeania sp. SIO2C2]|nr:hypothetical protein [Okeania sp. SIO2C2]NEP89155.1 hypothetical protein [Okeania sp. SIO2C2]
MNQSNTTIYQSLDYQINNLLNEKLAKKLTIGKYIHNKTNYFVYSCDN